MFSVAVEEFPWASEVQKEGFLNYVQYCASFGVRTLLPIHPLVPFFVQKDHESNEYWRETMAQQLSSLEDQIRLMQTCSPAEVDNSVLFARMEMLETVVKTQTLLIEQLTQKLKV